VGTAEKVFKIRGQWSRS